MPRGLGLTLRGLECGTVWFLDAEGVAEPVVAVLLQHAVHIRVHGGDVLRTADFAPTAVNIEKYNRICPNCSQKNNKIQRIFPTAHRYNTIKNKVNLPKLY